MELVVDANILFSVFWKDSFTKRIVLGNYFKLYSPEFCLEEIKKYKKEIIRKSKITEKEFSEIRGSLFLYITFIPESRYKKFLIEAKEFSPDKKDIDYFALCLKEKLPLWTNDSKLKRQRSVKVLNTSEVMNFVK